MTANRSEKGTRIVTQWIGIMLAGWLALGTAWAETRTWDGTTGNWSEGSKWDGTAPQDGDDVVINDGSVLLSADTAALSSFTMNGGTLTFTNWTTTLNATNVTIFWVK